MNAAQRLREFPLDWPEGWKRTKPSNRKKGHFQGKWKDEVNRLRKDLRLICKNHHFNLIISVNFDANHPLAEFASWNDWAMIENRVEVQFDGITGTAKEFNDPGVAISFLRNEKEVIMACDKWTRPRDNLRALMSSLMSLYKLDHWGCSDIMEKAFHGLEVPLLEGIKSWWKILEVDPRADTSTIQKAWKEKAKALHPDVGGYDSNMAEINAARDAGMKANKAAA